MDLCHVPISIGKFCQDFVACNVVDIDACHILLERSWQHEVDTTHKRKEKSMCSLERAKKLP